MLKHYATGAARVYILLVLLTVSAVSYAQQATLTGKVTDDEGTPLPFCNISILPAETGTVSETNGEFELDLPYGSYEAVISYVGYEKVRESFELSELTPTVHLTVVLERAALEQDEVMVYARSEKVSAPVHEIKQADVKNMPTLYRDVLRSVKILPGVTSNNELSSAYNVRGGTYTENLIYLNGYEIYRPFLVRQGVEENQTLINPDMIDEINFHGGAFPASYGDKMSSALDVDYKRQFTDELSGSVRADLMNAGVTIASQTGKLNWIASMRYAYPNFFLKELQTAGDYSPKFIDGQLLLNYPLGRNTEAELFLLQAYNQFDVKPESWEGHFRNPDRIIQQLTIDYDGERTYSYRTGLTGLKLQHRFTPNTRLTASAAYYLTREDERADLTGYFYHSPDAWRPDEGKRFLKTSFETNENYLDLATWELKSIFNAGFEKHSVEAGFIYRNVQLSNHVDEYFQDEGQYATQPFPLLAQSHQSESFNSISGYLQETINFFDLLKMNAGLRVTHNMYNEETLWSPRLSFRIEPAPLHRISASWGYYYQPPFFYEARLMGKDGAEPLQSQKSVHYLVGWEYRTQERMKLHVEAFYKQMDDLLPFYIDEYRITYMDGERMEGYAYGLDVMLEGEIVEDMNTWIGYSYLNSGERFYGEDTWRRRLLDQTHTIKIFLQDKAGDNKAFQSHVRFFFGSGYLYHPRKAVTRADETTELAVDFNQRWEFNLYMRADMGLTFRFDLQEKDQLKVIVEVLNVFNNYNVAAYSWVSMSDETGQAVRIPQIYSKRFFNVGFELAI